tara:strand:+ start:323 stop:727 length:405 start_codon:yes stop_codon:yes gene_type:complete
MAKYLWREEYATGQPEIDQQHQQLFALLDKLYDAVCAGGDDSEGQSAVEEVVTELVSYTRSHFFLEESLMRESGYFGLEQHQQEHQRLLSMVDEKMAALRRGDKIISIDLLEFMHLWLAQHIMKSDGQLAQFLR